MTRAARMLSRVLLLLVACASPLLAQAPPRDGKLLVTVVDQTRAVIPGATVTVTSLDTATKAAVEPAKTSDQGIATVAAARALHDHRRVSGVRVGRAERRARPQRR
jgi:hypothetical protein